MKEHTGFLRKGKELTQLAYVVGQPPFSVNVDVVHVHARIVEILQFPQARVRLKRLRERVDDLAVLLHH
jgi:hypothetical protein